MIIEKLIKRFTAKRVFVFSMLNFSLAMAILGKAGKARQSGSFNDISNIAGYYPTKVGVLLFSTSAGIVYGTLFTIPFLLVAQYHAKGTFKVRKAENNNIPEKLEPPVVEFERGLGTAEILHVFRI